MLVAVFVDLVADDDFVGVEPAHRVADAGFLPRRDVVQDVEAGEEQQLLVDGLPVEMGKGRDTVFAERLEVGKHARVHAQQARDDVLAVAVEAVEVVKRLLGAREHDARAGFGLLDILYVAGQGEHVQGTLHGSGLQLVGRAETEDVELVGAVLPFAYLELEEVGQAIVDHADVLALGVRTLQPFEQASDGRLGDEEVGCGGLSVAPGTAGFLIVLFGRGRDVDVDHGAHVRFVDAHAESVGGADDGHFAFHPRFLPLLFLPRGQPGVVERGSDAGRSERLGGLLGLAPRTHVDDGRTPVGEQPGHVGVGVVGVDHGVGEVGAHERGLEDVEARPELQPVADVAHHIGGRRGGQGDAGHGRGPLDCFGQIAARFGNAEVWRTEVVAPLRDAVRLVDHQKPHVHIR